MPTTVATGMRNPRMQGTAHLKWVHSYSFKCHCILLTIYSSIRFRFYSKFLPNPSFARWLTTDVIRDDFDFCCADSRLQATLFLPTLIVVFTPTRDNIAISVSMLNTSIRPRIRSLILG